MLLAKESLLFRRVIQFFILNLNPSKFRSRRVKGSCAFEHVFLGEVKRGVVKGFHNWLFFLMQEQKGEVLNLSDYLIESVNSASTGIL